MTDAYYTGVGSRETPPDVLALMTSIAEKLRAQGFILRSGHCEGADLAFEDGACGRAEIYLPWPGFGPKQLINGEYYIRPEEWTRAIAAEHHPRWTYLSPGVKTLHMRNVHQVLGPTPDSPVSTFLICWTPGAGGGGGTGQAIRIAKTYNVRVIDLADAGNRAQLEDFVSTAAAII